MNIFESLENLNVSEECFNDIMDIVEEIINEDAEETKRRLTDKYAPILKAKRRNLDLKVKKGQKDLRYAKYSNDLSKKIQGYAQKDLNKAENDVFDVMLNKEHTYDDYKKVANARKKAQRELQDWNRDVKQGESKIKDITNKVDSNIKASSELNKKVANIKGQSNKRRAKFY